MKNIKEFLKQISSEDYNNGLVNLHLHTTYSDGLADAQELLNAAKIKNLKYISITDHNTFEAHKIIKDEILITGAEFDCWYKGVFIHLLAYGVDIEHKSLQPFLAKDKKGTEDAFLRLFSKRDVAKLINAIHEANGVAVLAHPACYWAINLNHFINKLIEIGLDGIEVYYPYPRFRSIIKFHSSKKIKLIADNCPYLIKTGGTDLHAKYF